MKRYINSIKLAAALSIVVIAGCKKGDEFFQLRDRGGLDAQIWENEGAVQFFLNEAYDVIMPTFPYEYTGNNYEIHLASDENYSSANGNWGKRVLGLNGVLAANDIRYVAAKYQGSNMGDNRYFDVARCNTAIKFLPGSKTISNESKRRLLGQFYVLRGMVYLGLTKVYGGMPLVLDPQKPDNLQLAGRAKARDMFKQIVHDLDTAMVLLDGVVWNDQNERGKLTKAAAAALKAKALLYWASPQFNPVNDPAHPYDAGRWNDAFNAAKDAYEICIAANHSLMPNYADIFRIEGANNKEAIIVRSYSDKIAKRTQNVEAKTRPASEGGQPNDAFYATTRLVDAYTMIDGTPISQSADYDPVLFWQKRDPRFEATIAYNGSTWKLSGINNRKQWTYINAVNENGNRGFYCKRFTNPDLLSGSVRVANDFGGNGYDWIELRFAEVMLDYAETANETDNMTIAKDLVREIRKRAGIIEGSNDYGLALATNKVQMRDLIMNERMVEFAFEGKRADDLRRTRRLHLLTGTLETLQFQVKSDPLKTQLERVIDPVTGKRYRETLDLNIKDTVQKYFNYVITRPGDNGGFNVPEHYYFYSLSNQFLNSTPLLAQTIGWEGGTFDPLAN